MPGQTPNRAYPYPLDADPVDVALDIKKLADAVDADTNTLFTFAPVYADINDLNLRAPKTTGSKARTANPIAEYYYSGSAWVLTWKPASGWSNLPLGPDCVQQGGSQVCQYRTTSDGEVQLRGVCTIFGSHPGNQSRNIGTVPIGLAPAFTSWQLVPNASDSAYRVYVRTDGLILFGPIGLDAGIALDTIQWPINNWTA